MKIGERLKMLRKVLLHGIPQEKFAEKIGTTGAAISRYESSDRTIPNTVILSICREFNVNREWLENGNGDPFIDTKSGTLDKIANRYNSDGNDTFRAILDVYAQLNPAEQEAFESFIRKLASYYNNASSEKTATPQLGDPILNRLIREGATAGGAIAPENKAN